MAAKELMTWVPQARRWMKKLPIELQKKLGKALVAVSCRQLRIKPATKEGSRAAANEWWLAFVAEHAEPSLPKQSYWAEQRVKMAAWYRSMGNEAAAQAIEAVEDSDLNMTFAGNQVASRVWHDRIENQAKPAAPERQLGEQIQSFLAHKKPKMSVGGWDNLRRALNRLSNFVGADKAIDELTSPVIVAFHDYLQKDSDLSDGSKGDIQTGARQFINHLVESELIPMPGKLKSRSLRFSREATQIVVFDVPELQNIYRHSVDRT